MSDEYQSIPVAEARAAVQASGELEGIEGPLYLAEADARSEWLAYFSKSLYGESGHPEFAKVIVTRKGQKPREVVIAWDEYADQMNADPEWDALRAAKPMSIFGAEVERHAYRVVFADVLAKLERPRESPNALTEEQLQSLRDKLSAPARDWRADLAAASTKAEVDALFAEARIAKALTDPALNAAFGRRRREVPEGVLASWEPTPAPSAPSAPSPAAVAAKSKPLTVQPVKRPQGDRPQGQRRRGKR